MKNILVTGGLSFMGKSLVEKLAADNDNDITVIGSKTGCRSTSNTNRNVHTLYADLRDAHSFDWFTRYDTVYHYASCNGGMKSLHDHPASTLVDNNLMISNVLTRMKSGGKMVFISSCMVYDSSTLPVNTEDSLKDIPVPRSVYGFSKLCGEKLCEAYYHQHGVPYVICRPFNVFGPGAHDAHIIPDMINKICVQQLGVEESRPLTIIGDGSQSRCYTYVEDITRGIMLAAELGEQEAFNLSVSSSHSVMEVVRLIWRIYHGIGKPMHVKHLPTATYDSKLRMPSTERALAVLRWEPEYYLEHKMKETIEGVLARVKHI